MELTFSSPKLGEIPLFGDPAAVELVEHVVMETSPTGPTPVRLNQYQVYLHCAGLLSTRPGVSRLQVGFIGTQDGANFCPILAFYECSGPQQEWIVSEAKRLHGRAAAAPPADIPPPEPGEPLTIDVEDE